MYYKFKKSDLINLIKIEEIDLNVNKLLINKYVNEGRVFIEDSDDLKTRSEKRIAYLIINHDEICISFVNEKNVENNIPLLAALLSDAREFTIKLSESSLQEEFINKYDIKPTEFRENNHLNINEDFLMGLTKDGWDNKDFIFKKLNTYKETYSNEENNKQLAVELVSYIPSEQWQDEEFIHNFFSHPAISKIIEHAINKEKNKTYDILFNEKILTKSIELGNKYLIHHYVKIYDELASKSTYGNYSITKERNNNSIPELVKKEEEFIPHIKKYFKELDYAKEIIKNLSEDYFKLFDLQLRKNKDFKEQYITLALNYLEKQAKGSSSYIWGFTSLVGVDAFSDIRIQEFAIKNGEKIHDNEHKPLLAAEIIKNTNEEIARIISIGKGIDFIWDYLSKEQKQEKIIAKSILKQNPKIYNKLNETLRLDKEVFKIYYNQLKEFDLIKDFKVGKISKEFFESFEEEEIIDLINIVPDFLLEEKFPEKYWDNMKVMAQSNKAYHVFQKLYQENERYKKTIEKVFQDKELSMIMLEKQNNIFSLLSEDLRTDMEVLEKYVKTSYHYENLPPKVFLNKNLLLHIIRAKPNFIEKIPQEYFKDQDFLLRIFSKIDKKELSEQVLHSLPTVVNEILNTTPLKIGEYYEFFSKTFTNMNLTQKLEPGKNLKIKKAKI